MIHQQTTPPIHQQIILQMSHQHTILQMIHQQTTPPIHQQIILQMSHQPTIPLMSHQHTTQQTQQNLTPQQHMLPQQQHKCLIVTCPCQRCTTVNGTSQKPSTYNTTSPCLESRSIARLEMNLALSSLHTTHSPSAHPMP